MGANSFYYSAFNDEEKLCLAGTPKVSLLTYSELRSTSSSALGSFDDSKSISSDLAICHGGQKGTEYGYWQIQGRYVDENGIASSFSSYSTKYALRPTITLDTSKVLYGRVESTSAGEKTYIVGRCQDEDNTVVIDSSIEQEGENYKITYSTAGCEGKTISLIVRNQDKALVAGFYSIETGNDKTISFNKSILDGSGYIINFYSNVSQSNVDIFKTPVGSLVKGSSGAKEVTIQWDNGTLIRKEYVLAGQKLVNPMTPDNITVDGVQKGFVKWTKIAPTDVSGDVQLSARASYNFDDAVNNGFTLYAAYSNAYNLTYKTLGDSGYTDVVKTMTAECAITGEDKIEGIVPDSLASQIEFKYWTSDEEAYTESGSVNPNTFFYQDGGKATSNMPEEFDFASGISRDTTLYPVYAYKQYGVTFYTGEVVPGSSCDDYYGSDATNTQVTYNYGETIIRDNRISCPASADGFEFVGWSQSATSYIPNGESQVTSAGTVLYPYYTRNHYTVTAISNNYATIVILEVDANSYEGDIVSNLDGDNIGDQTVDTYHGRTFYFSVKPKDNYNKTQIVYSLLNIYRVIGEETVSAGSWCSASTYIPTYLEDNTYYFKIENVENDFCIKVVELSENYNTITVTVPTSGGEDFTVLINGVAYTGTVSGGNATYIGGSMGAYSVAIRYNGSSCDQRLADLIGKITIVGTTETFARQGNVLILSSEDPLTDDITITLTSWDLALNQYTVGYKYFDGTGTATTKYWNGTSFDSIASTTVDNCSLAEHGSEVTIPASCPVETYIKDGIKYTFSGWDTNGDGEYEEDDNSFVITQNRVINAVYTPTQLYTVSYRYYVVNTTTTPTTATRQVRYWDVDNIMFKDNSNVGIVDKDTNITIASQADAQAQMFYSSDGKVKYTFVGWDTNGDGVYDESDSRELLVTSDMLIDAIYSESYLVVVDNNEALNANISSATTQATERFIIPESNKTYYWVKFGEAINVQVVVKTGFRAIFDISCIKVTSNVPSGHTISYAIGDSSTDAGEYLISNVTCPITISCRTLPTATYDVKVTVDNVVIPSTNVYINGINHSGNTAKVADNASVTIIAIASSRYSQAFERSEGIINCTATIGGDSYTLTPVLSGTTITLSIPASDVVGEIVVNITSSASLNTYNVTFNYFDNNGIYSTHSENVGHGDTIDSPEVTGYTAHPYTYTFSKWTTSAGDWDQSTPIEEDVIITAQYTSVACSYEVTLTTNDYATISCVGESDDTRAYDISGDSLLVPYEGALFIKVVVGDTYRSSGFGPDDLILTNSLEEGNPHATYVLDTSDSRNNPENAANGIYYYKIEHVRNNFSVECADLSKTRYAVSVNITEPTTVPTPTNNSLIQVAIGGASYNNNTVKLDNNAVVNIVITLAKNYNNDQNYNNLFNAIVNGGYSKNKHDTTQTVDGITYDKCIVIGPITVDRDISITIDAFNLTHNPCTVTLKNGDTPFGSFQYAYGGSLSISNETLETLAGYSSVPTQDEDDQYTYTFDCWGVEGYSADTGSISVIRDIVLYAKFTRALRTYTVTLPTGGTKYTIEHYSNTDGKVAYGCTYTFLVKVNSGYSQAIPSPTSDFGGIVRGGAELNLNEGMHFFYISNVTQDISITLDDTAWALNSYNIMFNYYDEDSDTWIEYGNDTPQKVQLVEYNSHASKPTAPTALGKTFVEWYADKDYISVYDFATSVRGNISLYARFVTDNYVVKVVGQTGSIENVLLNKTFEMRSELVSIDIPEDRQDEVIRAYTGLVYDRAEAPKITFRINKFYKNALGEKVTIGEVNFDNLKVIALPKGGTPSVLVGTSDVDGDGFGYIEYLNIQITADTEIYISDVEDVVLNVTFLKSYNNEEIDWSELYNSEPQYNYNDVIIRPDKTGKDFGEENVFGDKFKFMGFFYKIDDETNTAREEDRVTFGTDSITFSTTIYALIEPIYYSVTFEYNNTSKVVKVAYGEKVREPSLSDEELGIASNEQKIGWETVGGYAFDFGTTLDDACDCADHTPRTMTLALVKGIKQFSITYYDKDNQIIGESDTLDYGSHVTAPADPIVEGYNFVGWKTTGDRGGDNFAFTTTEITEDINLYATYERIFVTATFYIDGAKVGEKTVEYGASIPESEWPTIPSKTGYDQATPSWDKSEEQLTELKSNIIVNAVYTINKYTINIVQNGKVINTLTYNYGENISVDVLPDSNILYDFAYNRGLLVNVNDNRDIVIKKVFSGMFYYIIFGSIAFVGVTALVALIIVKKVTTAKYNEKKAKEITQKLEKLKQKDIGKE